MLRNRKVAQIVKVYQRQAIKCSKLTASYEKEYAVGFQKPRSQNNAMAVYVHPTIPPKATVYLLRKVALREKSCK